MKQIQILGSGCAKCKKLSENAETAAQELGLEFALHKVIDFNQIMQFGVMSTPAIVIDGDVKAVGKICSVEEIKSFLK